MFSVPVKQFDLDLAGNIHLALKLEHTPQIAKVFMASRQLNGLYHVNTMDIFNRLLTKLQKYSKLMNAYYKGEVDGQKRNPYNFSFDKDMNTRIMYQMGKYIGEEILF